jgi:predicted SAM-dependent methyltransferase
MWYDNCFKHNICDFETINFQSYSCPYCGVSDRQRFYALYLKKIAEKESFDKKSLLYVAPQVAFESFLKKLKFKRIITVDLYMKNVDEQLDITNLYKFKDESFDMIICSHVLEHIVDDFKAASELFRVMAFNGKGIIMVPVMLSLDENYENKNAVTEQDRIKNFGQEDHVRMYSKKGLKKLLYSVGFNVQEVTVYDLIENEYENVGIHPRSVLYIVEKQVNNE